MEEKFVLGITGGVGSGKSTVLDILKNQYGARIIQADQVARELMEPGGTSYQAVLTAFGESILQQDGSIDRGRLAEIIFASEEKREYLNQLTHPLVRQEVKKRIQEAKEELIVYEAALPREAGFSEICREIWYVHTPREIRIQRLMDSRGYSRTKCEQIMDSQIGEEAFRKMAQKVVENGESLEEMEKQLQILLQSGILGRTGVEEGQTQKSSSSYVSISR